MNAKFTLTRVVDYVVRDLASNFRESQQTKESSDCWPINESKIQSWEAMKISKPN